MTSIKTGKVRHKQTTHKPSPSSTQTPTKAGSEATHGQHANWAQHRAMQD